nr:hypothetical protein [Roseovarius aestuariivivens]
MAFLPSALFAQPGCAPRDVIVARLAETYGESRQSIGLGANNAVVEIFASAETGTWSITVTSVRGMTCLVASGEAFETIADVLPAEGNDA